jgi:hypothetical protein
MSIDPNAVLSRLALYPSLSKFINPQWVRRASTDRSITLWHAFFEEDERYSSAVLGNLDRVIGYLLLEDVAGTAARARGLCTNTKDGFWSSLTELVQGAKLRKGYSLQYLAVKGTRTPDIEVATPRGNVYVEITSMHRTWDFSAISQYIGDAVNGIRHGYRIGAECPSDSVKIPVEALQDLSARVKAQLELNPFPTDERTIEVFRSVDGRVSVTLSPSKGGIGYVATGTSGGFAPRPDSNFGRIMTTIEEKAPQMAAYRPSVLVIELANETGNIAVLGGHDSSWQVYGAEFRLNEIPSEIDLVILTWQSIYGETWGTARALRNPTSAWAQSPDAQEIVSLIASQL